jgi:hypothetical protein
MAATVAERVEGQIGKMTWTYCLYRGHRKLWETDIGNADEVWKRKTAFTTGYERSREGSLVRTWADAQPVLLE